MTKLLKVLAFACIPLAVAWTSCLLLESWWIYVAHTSGSSFVDWIVEIQVRGTENWPVPTHSTFFYVARFFLFTLAVVAIGVWGYLYLRGRTRQERTTV
jgi:hypothetical protein